jgi:hypothetical protein
MLHAEWAPPAVQSVYWSRVSHTQAAPLPEHGVACTQPVFVSPGKVRVRV